MENFNNDEVNKMLEMLKEQAQSNEKAEHDVTQATENNVDSADELKDMLKKQFSAGESAQNEAFTSDYSFDEVNDFVADEQVEIEEENIVDEIDSILKEAVVEQIGDVEETEEIEDLEETEEIEEVEEINEDENDDSNDIDIIYDVIEDVASKSVEIEEESFDEVAPEEITLESDNDTYAIEEAISEESINYDEVLEGQQGTVFNEFVEDFTGELDDVVFEAEITDSHAPNKQYTIFEDWEQLMKSKDFATVEEDIIPPDEEMNQAAEAPQKQNEKTDYFNPVISDNDLDAVDIALMVALGGKSELNQTVGFEKIRQAVAQTENEEVEQLDGKKIYGYCNEEYSSIAQNSKIKKTYHNNKIKVIVQLIGTAILALTLIGYEISGWLGNEFSGIFEIAENPEFHVLAGLILLAFTFAISGNKILRVFNDPLSFSSVSYISALVALFVSMLHDTLIMLNPSYATPGQTLHFASAILLVISLVYDLFDVLSQSGVFNIVASSEKKLILEPYGKIRVDEDIETGEVIDKDSYCISRVPSVKKYFARTSRPASDNFSSKLISLVISFSVAICVLLLLLIKNSFLTALLGFLITISFLLICTSIFETETAFFVVYKLLKKYKTGIIGKSSVSEHGKCNIVYFDDFNVFNKKSVRTKGLKLYDNNEIYRILYHTQAVFSKVGGPLKGVFEFATTEMSHSKKVEIKEISKDGISAIVDGRTSVLIGTGAFMKSRYIHPSYTPADVKLEEKGEESIMFIALNGVLGAKLYVTYQFSAEFEKLAKKLNDRGVNIGIRSSDPNINNNWAKRYGELKQMPISIVRPTLKEIKPNEKSIESGVISTKNVRALAEALMMCIKLDNLEGIFRKIRAIALVLMGILSFVLISLSGSNISIITLLALSLGCALCTSVMMMVTYFYVKH